MEGKQEVIARQYFVEQAGATLERVGMPRMAGRALGWLLICDPPHQSPGELAAALQASKASISTSLRFLTQIGLIERTPLPGKRRDYFRLREHAWSRTAEERLPLVTELRGLAERGLTLREGDTAEATRSLREMRDFYAFYERELPALIARWRREWQERQREEEGR